MVGMESSLRGMQGQSERHLDLFSLVDTLKVTGMGMSTGIKGDQDNESVDLHLSSFLWFLWPLTPYHPWRQDTSPM